jgi:uncharacterized protein (DUF2147 family)
MSRRKASLSLATAIFAALTWAGRAEAASVDGTWKIRNLVLDIHACESHVCGTVVWTAPEQRKKECGKVIVWGLSADGPSNWTGGSIFDPKDGTTYNLSASLQPDGTLRARIYRGFEWLGKTENLSRVPDRSLAGWC